MAANGHGAAGVIGLPSVGMLDDDDDDECGHMLKELKSELMEVEKQEARVEGELKGLLASINGTEAPAACTVTHGRQMAQQLEAIERSVYPRLDVMSSKVVGLSEHIYSCQELADKMSCTVRKLDERQMRVHKVLAMVEDVINLKTCAEGVERALEEGDLPDAVSYVKQFHGIEGPAAKASEHYDFMVDSEKRLKDTVMRKVQHAVSSSNLEDVFRFCPLLGPLGLAAEGAKIYESFAQRLLHDSLEQYDALGPELATSKSSAVAILPKVFNAVAAFLQHHLPLVAHGFKQVDADLSLIRLVHRECEQVAIPILHHYITTRALADKCRRASSSSSTTTTAATTGASSTSSAGGGGGGLNLGELDELLDELALVIQQTESYDRYVRYLANDAKSTATQESSKDVVVLPAVSELNSAVAEVSGPYTLLEYHLMKTSVRKAIQIDEAPRLGPGREGWTDGRTSSCVEDSFYVIKRCSKRALVTGHAGTASAIVNYVNSTLTDDLLGFLLTRVTSITALPSAATIGGAPVAAAVRQQWTKVKEGLLEAAVDNPNLTAVAGSISGALGGIGATSASLEQEALQSLDRLITVNNLAACAIYTTKLHQELLADVPAIYQDDPSTQQLMACLQDLSQTSKHFSQAVDEALDHVAALIKPRIRAFLLEALGDKSSSSGSNSSGGLKVSFEMDEALFAQSQTVDPYAHKLVEFLTTLLQPIAIRLAERHYDRVQHVVADYLCKRLEALLIKKRFTQLGGLQLDKDLRCILGFFPNRSGSRPFRDRFARLHQMCMILNLDSAADLADASVQHWKLTPDEVLAVLKRRVDFTEAEIAAAVSSLGGGGRDGDGVSS